MTKTATALSSKTGLDYVVKPIHYGISSGVSHVSSGVGHVSSVAGSMAGHVMHRADGDGSHRLDDRQEIATRQRRRGSMEMHSDLSRISGEPDRPRIVHRASTEPERQQRPGSIGMRPVRSDLSRFYGEPDIQQRRRSNELRSDFYRYTIDDEFAPANGFDQQGYGSFYDEDDEDDDGFGLLDLELDQDAAAAEDIDPALTFPEQNIDIQGPSTGKKLTDDLAEIKDKMHELTWHLFDDHTYVLKHPNALFFGESSKPTKRQKPDPTKKLDKYLHMGQYSHSNPFVARVGMYVEPITGSTYSILCLFRAGFNVVTWRDPMLTFWLSFFCGLLSLVLFFFPWRIFLFIVGVLFVGPQNWIIRILREQGRIPPAPKFSSKKDCSISEDGENFSEIPTDKPVFTRDCRQGGNGPRKPIDSSIDPREIHHVVVPYSALFYQRCNDWPPEPQYARVDRNTSFDDARKSVAGAMQFRRSNSYSSEHSSNGGSNSSNRLGRLRRRLRRDRPGSSNEGRPPIGPSRNRTSTKD